MFIAFVLVGLLFFGQVAAQDYPNPNRNIRIIVGNPPGGNVDVSARVVAQKLGERFGSKVVVENRPGALGTIAGEYVSKATPDGYTLLASTAGITTIRHLYSKMPYDPIEDFVPVVLIATYNGVVVVHPTVPVKTVKELVALAKARPGSLTFSSGGAGGVAHLAGELFNEMARVNILHVPYRGAAQSLIAVVGGEVDMMFNTISLALEFIKAGKIRAIAVTEKQRSSLLPRVPTVAESFPGYEASNWVGIFVSKGTSSSIIRRLNSEISLIMSEPETAKLWKDSGIDFSPNSPKEFAAYVKKEYVRYGKLINKLEIKSE